MPLLAPNYRMICRHRRIQHGERTLMTLAEMDEYRHYNTLLDDERQEKAAGSGEHRLRLFCQYSSETWCFHPEGGVFSRHPYWERLWWDWRWDVLTRRQLRP